MGQAQMAIAFRQELVFAELQLLESSRKRSFSFSSLRVRGQLRTTIKSQVLADFVIDFSAKVMPEVEQEASRTSPKLSDLWVLYTDGASNVLGSGQGLVFEDGVLPPDKKEAKELRMKAARYNIINHDLYKRTFGSPLAKWLEPNQTRRILEEVHEGHCGGHNGIVHNEPK
uniref:Reverse transcriptase RNase H-like domain-containing protein n=2 Tax=Nicotiana TaxID=4085 RepID=A0A1S4D0X8_TOBAC|nr:PREDICTED: uncharacterized protein LOC104230135 [Nicotiana sylvestris]XP_016506924.1 PREDICTED: uncharacterized protein LOC107824638 [Nicotiana tabacum]